MLRIENVTKSFACVTAVNNLSLHIPAGEIHAFLGPNGAGKTTTIKMCTGLLIPDSGSIHINGYDVVSAGIEARKSIAYVPDEPYLYDRLTGREFLDFTSRIYGMSRNDYNQLFDQVCERFSLGEFIDQLAEGYSHGMRQRVVLAAAMLHRPKLLIVDEPLVGLDPKHIRIVLELLKEFVADGGAVLMSTHTLMAVEHTAHHITVMDHGNVLARGSIDELRGEKSLEDTFLSLTEETNSHQNSQDNTQDSAHTSSTSI